MYNISELNQMDEAALRGVAEKMGLKSTDATSKQDLIYTILDQQAVDRASAGAERRRQTESEAPVQEAKKRTRRKKADDETPKGAESPDEKKKSTSPGGDAQTPARTSKQKRA